MLELETKLTLNRDIIEAKNLCDRLSERDLEAIGNWCYDGYQQDWNSCASWRKRTAAALDLAMQIVKGKNFPWPNCANVAFPLVTIGVLQFHSRAYPALISGTDVVKMRVVGPDPKGIELQRASRVSTHMSYQVLEEDEAWESEHDKLLVNIACVGTAYTQTIRKNGINLSEFVMAKDLVVDYWTKSLESCPRKTHIVPMYRNEIYERVKRGEFRDVLKETWYNGLPAVSKVRNTDADKRHGQQPPQGDETTPFTTLVQDCEIDFDDDGYAEPYIVTFEEGSKKVLRVVTRFDREEDIERNRKNEIIKINAWERFTKYGFIPSPDGGFLDIGFGVLLGPLNETTNTLVNQLLDSGTLNTTAGGFLGRGAKIRGGNYTFAPFTWARVDSTGDDLRKSVFPLPIKEPSQVLFSLLGLILQYADRIPGSTEINVGENVGQNTPAETSRIMSDEGRKIYSAIFKRIWRSMKDEFKKLYVLNGIYLPVGRSVQFGVGGQNISREDYLGDPSRVIPAADPNVTSEASSLQRALALKQAAMTTEGYDRAVVERQFLRAMKVQDIDTVYPGPGKVPPLMNPKIQVEQLKLEGRKLEMQLDDQHFMLQLMEEKKLNQAKIVQLMAQAESLIAEIGAKKAAQQIAAFDAAIGALKLHSEHLSKRIELMLKKQELDDGRAEQRGVARLAGPSGDTAAAQVAANPQTESVGAAS